MTRPPAPRKKKNLLAFADRPQRAGHCAVEGGYIADGVEVTYFGEKYVCRAPNLVPVQDTK